MVSEAVTAVEAGSVGGTEVVDSQAVSFQKL
jgi:hypothetical protein